jgi:SNF2 family DNA or RNA helicase
MISRRGGLTTAGASLAQSAALLSALATTHGVNGPFLVVAPVSTLPHWHRELERWTELNAVVYAARSQFELTPSMISARWTDGRRALFARPRRRAHVGLRGLGSLRVVP